MMEFVYPHTRLVAGVDEVGRGPLVGAVVTAAVILDPDRPIIGLNDSKKLSEKRRLALFSEIQEKALAWSLGRAEPHEIDELNILHATMLAMQQALNLGMEADFQIATPLMWLNKAQTWELAQDLGGPALVELIRHETHSCYMGDHSQQHDWGYGCGTCPACVLRAQGWQQWKAGKA